MISKQLPKSASALRNNNLSQTQQILNNLSQTNKYSIDILLNKSTIAALNNNNEDSIKYLQQANHIDTFDYRIYYNLFVIYMKSKQYQLAYINIQKCISILYCIKFNQNPSNQLLQLLDRSISIWPQNTAAYALKSIYLITINQLNSAQQVIKQALQKCIIKHHIYAIACIIDSKLNRQVQRQQNAKDYHNHLLKHINSIRNIQSTLSQQEYMDGISQYVKEFNVVVKNVNIGEFREYENKNKDRDVLYMSNKGKTSINIEYEISQKLGVCNLACIKQDQQEDNGDNGDNGEPGVQFKTLMGNFYIPNQKDRRFSRQQNNEQKPINANQNQQKQHKDNTPFKNYQASSISSQSKTAQKPTQQLLYPITALKFQIKLLMADLQISQQLTGKLDPYVYYQYGSQKHKTTIAKTKDSTHIKWHNQVKVFSLQRNPTMMKVSVYDRQIFKWDQIVGEGKVQIIKTGQKVIPIYLNNKISGEVILNITKVY